MKKSAEQIHKNMKAVKCKDTAIECTLRKELWARGLRYRKNVKTVPGKPDLCFIGKKVAVFCDSEFFHGYDWEKHKNDFKSNAEFWINKIEGNMRRDAEVNEILSSSGWRVVRFWGREIKKDPSGCADRVEKILKENGKA